MALWTDADVITSADLVTLDSEVQDVASAEGIAPDAASGGVLRRATEGCANQLLALMQQFGGYLSNQSVSSNHYAAVMNIGLPAVQRSKVLITQAVVSTQVAGEWSPLKTWVAYKGLAAFFRDASHRTNNDRYDAKATAYSAYATKTAWEHLNARGLPIVRAPLPCPGAIFEPGAGCWGAGSVTQAAAPGAASGEWDVVITWVQAGSNTWLSPTKKQNGESGPSAVVSTHTDMDNAIRVSIAALTAPNGTQPESTVSTAIVPYGVATGWMVYAGPQGGPLYLQTPNPLPLTQTVYTLPSDPAQTGYTMGTGQWPDLWYAFTRTVQRG